MIKNRKMQIVILLIFLMIFSVHISAIITTCDDCPGVACCRSGGQVCCGECCWAMPGGCISGPCPYISS